MRQICSVSTWCLKNSCISLFPQGLWIAEHWKHDLPKNNWKACSHRDLRVATRCILYLPNSIYQERLWFVLKSIIWLFTWTWSVEELRAIKWLGQCLQQWWRKTRNKCDQTWARVHFRACSMVVMAVKKAFSFATTASARSCPAELLRLVHDLLRLAFLGKWVGVLDCLLWWVCKALWSYLFELDSGLTVPEVVRMASSNSTTMDSFQLFPPEEVNRGCVFCSLRPS